MSKLGATTKTGRSTLGTLWIPLGVVVSVVAVTAAIVIPFMKRGALIKSIRDQGCLVHQLKSDSPWPWANLMMPIDGVQVEVLPGDDEQRFRGLLPALEQCRDLEWLVLDGRNIGDQSLAALAASPLARQLKHLGLSGTLVTDEGLAHLAGMSQLESLSLDGTAVTGAGMEHLRGLVHLSDLSVSNTDVTEEGLSVLSDANPELSVSDD